MKRKILIFIVLITTLFGLKKVKADNLYYADWSINNNIYYVQDGLPDFYGSDFQYYFNVNGIPAYCMDPGAPLNTNQYNGIFLKDTTYDLTIQEKLNKIIYYGYEYPNHQTEKYYMATQALVWETISNYWIGFFTERYGYGTIIDVEDEKNEILNLINNHYNIPYYADKTYDYNSVDYIEFEDSNINNFEIIESNWSDISIENNKLTINNLENFNGQINFKFKKKYYKNTQPMYYYSSGSQSLITGGQPEDLIITLSLNITNSKIRINKLDSISNLPIKNSNIKFNIKNINTNEYVYINGSKDLQINDEGYLLTPSLSYGTYEIQEISTSDEYVLSQEIKTINVNSDSIVEVNFYNDLKRGKIELTKIDSVSKKSIPDIEFTLYADEDIITSDGTIHYRKDSIVSKNLTDNNGKIIFDNLVYGNYYLKETATINAYVTNRNKYPIFLNQENYTITIENDLAKANVNVTKYGEIFNYQNPNNNGEKILENIEFIIYANEDIITPDGTIHYKKGDIVETKTTDANGSFNIKLLIGKYCFRETNIPDEYQLEDYCYTFKSQGYSLNITNNLKKGRLKILKIDSSSNLLIKNKNIKFNIRNIETGEYLYINNSKDLNINKNGYLLTPFIPYGTYEIKEVATIDEYNLNEEIKIVTIDENTVNDDNIIEINYYNDLKKGKIELNKIDNFSKRPIPNIEFTLYADEDIITSDGTTHYRKDSIVSKNLTDSNGKIIFDNLVYGNYYLKETGDNPWYIQNNNKYNINLNEEITYVNIENELKKKDITLQKYGEVFNYNNPSDINKIILPNVEFMLFAKEDIVTPDGTIYYKKDDIIQIKTTDDNGKIVFNDLIIGKYCIKEIRTSNIYELDNNTYCFDLLENNENYIENINYLKKGNLKINKLDSSSNLPIKNSKIMFNIKNINTNEYIYVDNSKDLTINNEGYLLIENIPYGIYEIKEIKTSNDYYLNKEIKNIIITEETLNKNNIVEINYYNDLKKGKIQINKLGEIFNFNSFEYTFAPLENVEFILYAAEEIKTSDDVIHYKKGDIVDSKKTDELGNILFDDLIFGKYCIKEIKTKDGYILDTKEYCFDLYENIDLKLKLTNYLDKKDLIIIKKDSITGDTLKGVIFEIYYEDISLGEYETDEEGIIKIENLPVGNYYIKEIKTLDNYLLDEEIKLINLKEENEIIIENKEKIIVPNTIKNNYLLGIFGFNLIIGILLQIYEFKKNK